MKRYFIAAIDEDLKVDFELCSLYPLMLDQKIEFFYFNSWEQVLNHPQQPFIIISNKSLGHNLLVHQWYLCIGQASTHNSNNLFQLDNLEGEAARKLFKIIYRQHLSASVLSVKENAYDLSMALCMRAAQSFRSLLEDIQSHVESERVDHFFSMSVDFLAAHERFYSSADEDELMAIFNDFIQPHGVLVKVALVKGDQSEDFIRLDQAGYNFLPLFFDEAGGYLAYRVAPHQSPDVVAFYLFSLMDVLSRFVHSMDLYRSALSRNNLWEEVFALVSMPISLISDKGELLLHNQDFLRLNILPGQCLAFLDGAEFEKDQALYKVFRKKIEKTGQQFFLFSFVSIETASVKRGKNISSEQLGIISSSIAHELNNPLGGILAALSLLELEDWWDQESRTELREMKKSAERCKNLVQVFLGFSRTSHSIQNKIINNFDSAFDQAQQLVRFRMIESNTYFTFSRVNTSEIYRREFNTSAASMVFYLILSEILTLFSHHKLVAEKDGGHIEASIAQYEDRVELEFDEELDIAERVNQSKLMSQLIDMEGLSLYADGNKIIFQ